MNFLIRLLLVVSILSISLPRTFADSFIKQSDVPANAWESHAGSIDLVVTLTTKVEKNGPSSELNVYIKNTSSTVKALAISSLSDWGFSFFVTTSDGTRHLLHDYDPHYKLPSGQPANLLTVSGRLKEIAPGQTISDDVPISLADLTLIKSGSIGWSLRVVDSKTGQIIDIKAAPRILTERINHRNPCQISPRLLRRFSLCTCNFACDIGRTKIADQGETRAHPNCCFDCIN